MGYGVIAEQGGSHLIWIPHDPHYGEDRTEVIDMTDLWGQDVSVHVALATVDLYQATRADDFSIGIMGYVKDGDYRDQGTDAGAWPTFLYEDGVSMVRFAYRLSVNGGFIKGSHFIQYWGDPHPTKQHLVRHERMRVAFDPATGNIRHVHRELVGTGDATRGGPDDDPIDVARSLGHEGPLELAEFEAVEMTPGLINVSQLTRV